MAGKTLRGSSSGALAVTNSNSRLHRVFCVDSETDQGDDIFSK